MGYWLAFFLFSQALFAARCDSVSSASASFKTKLEAFTATLEKMNKASNPTQELNAFIKKEGLLLDVTLSDEAQKKVSDKVSVDSPASNTYGYFLKKLLPDPKLGLTLDEVIELESPTHPKKINRWYIPSNQIFSAVEGKEIFHQTTLRSPCAEVYKAVTLAISPNGSFRAVPLKDITMMKDMTCPAMAKFVPANEEYRCVEMIDLKSRKKRYFIFASPIT